MQVVTVDNLGASFDVGGITPGKIEVVGAGGPPLLDPLSSVPGLVYVAGGGSGSNLTSVVTTLVGQTPYALHYRIVGVWTQGGSTRTRLRITGVDVANLFGLSFGAVRNDNNVGANGVSWIGDELIFQNVSGVSGSNPLIITVYFSVMG